MILAFDRRRRQSLGLCYLSSEVYCSCDCFTGSIDWADVLLRMLRVTRRTKECWSWIVAQRRVDSVTDVPFV